jgi:phage terminase large subunit GpA-like protein
VIEESDKLLMLKNGRWIPENPSSRIPGFRLSALYSPFFPWSRLVERWLRDKADPLKLRTFINTMLCEPWEETGEAVTAHVLQHHADFDSEKDGEVIVPMKAGVLTRSVDVQGDRLETTVYSWGGDEESWRSDFELIPGDPATEAPWNELARLLVRTYKHESGVMIRPAITFVDTGGHHAKQAYDFCRRYLALRVFAIKGSSLQQGVPLLEQTSAQQIRARHHVLGRQLHREGSADVAARQSPGAGPGLYPSAADIDPARMDQFLNEQLVTRFIGGRPIRAWVQRGPNEEVDLFVYALAALQALGPRTVLNLGAIAKRLAAKAPTPAAPASADPDAPATESEQTEPEEPQRPKKKNRRSRWVDGWRD